MASNKQYRIHPGIGIARVGDHPDKFFLDEGELLAPLSGGGLQERDGFERAPPYKSGGRVKRQACRFRIFEYVKVGGFFVPNREMTLESKDVVKITWTVHVANTKASGARFQRSGVGPPRNPHVEEPKKTKEPSVRQKILEIDPGPREITAEKKRKPPERIKLEPTGDRRSQTWPEHDGTIEQRGTRVINYLGELLTDPAGRLLVLGGRGKAAPSSTTGKYVRNEYNNDYWFDDVSDGWVKAEITFNRAGTKEAEPAWVIVGPPDFAPDLNSVVTLYDVLYDLAARVLPIPEDQGIYNTALRRLKELKEKRTTTGLADYQVSFDEEIRSLLERTIAVRFVLAKIRRLQGKQGGHSLLQQLVDAGGSLGNSDFEEANRRRQLFARVRPPEAWREHEKRTKSLGLATMPRLLWGLTLTETQYLVLKRWCEEPNQSVPSPASPRLPVIRRRRDDKGKLAQAIAALDRYPLERCSGGDFSPGIEVGKRVTKPENYSEPFRIDVKSLKPGDLTRELAVPWQADFSACKGTPAAPGETTAPPETGFWPASRPEGVYLADGSGPEEWDRQIDQLFEKTKQQITSEQRRSGQQVSDDLAIKYQIMVDAWKNMRFVLKKGDEYRESEEGEEEEKGKGRKASGAP